MTPQTVIVPIMFELSRKDGEVVLGPGSQKACDKAIKAAREIGPGAVILLSATRSPEGVIMGKVAQDYIEKQAPEVATAFHEAKWFRTIGEIWALAEYIKKAPRTVTEVVVTIKWWHVLRTDMIIRMLFQHADIQVPYTFRVHWFPYNQKHILHEMIGVVQNWLLIKWLFVRGNRIAS